MGEYRHAHNGFIVPVRDGDAMVVRREQGLETALAALPLFVPEDRRRVCVEAGGNWGLWPLRFAEMFETVYTFEPDHECFASLVYNCRNKANVVCLQAALGQAHKLVGLERDVDTTGNQHINGPGIYPTLCIDDLGLPVCDLIYLDVEGWEMSALWGAWATLLRCQPIIVFEATRKLDSQNLTEAYMTKYGYHKLGTIGRDVVMGPKGPEGEFVTKSYELNGEGALVEVAEC